MATKLGYYQQMEIHKIIAGNRNPIFNLLGRFVVIVVVVVVVVVVMTCNN